MSGNGADRMNEVTAVDPDEWLRAFDKGEDEAAEPATKKMSVSEQLDVDAWMRQFDEDERGDSQQQQQQQQQQEEGSPCTTGWQNFTVDSYALQREMYPPHMFRTLTPPPMTPEEFEVLRAKDEMLIKTNSELRLRSQEREAQEAKFMQEALPIMAKVLDEESLVGLRACVESNDFAAFCALVTAWMDGVIVLNAQLEGERARLTAQTSHLEKEHARLSADLDDAEDELERTHKVMEEMRAKAKTLIEQEKEAGKLAFDKVAEQYKRLAEHAQTLEKDIDQMATKLSSTERERNEARAALEAASIIFHQERQTSGSEEQEQLKKELEQAEAVFNEVKKQNDQLEEERRKLLARLQWKDLDTERRWDGGNSDDENEDGVEMHPDAAGAALKMRKRKINKEKAKKMTFARYLESVQREASKNAAAAVRNGQQASMLRRSNRELRAANAELEITVADLRSKVFVPGTLLSVDKTRRQIEAGELPPDQVRDELMREIDKLQAEVHSLKWRFVGEQKKHVEALKVADEKAKALLVAEQKRTDLAEQRLVHAEKEAAAKEKGLLQNLESLKQANDRRTQAKNAELEEARNEISELKKSGNSLNVQAVATAMPLEAKCGGIALQILAMVAGKHASESPVIAEFHQTVAAINKARLTQSSSGGGASHNHLLTKLYACMSRVCDNNAGMLQLYHAFDQIGQRRASFSNPGGTAVVRTADGEEIAQGISLLEVSRDSQSSVECFPGPLWQEYALSLHPLLHIFTGFADFVTRGTTWRRDRPDMRAMYERLHAAAEATLSVGANPPSREVIKAVRDALGAKADASQGAFVNLVENFARGCVAVNTNFAAETLKQLEEEKARNAKMHEYNKTLAKKLEVTIADLLKGIQADPSNPLDARDRHMLMSMTETLASVEIDMRKEAGGSLPPFMENYVNSVKVAWQFLSKTFLAMHPATTTTTGKGDNKRQRQEEEEEEEDEPMEDIEYGDVPLSQPSAAASSPVYQTGH